jgi:AraC-like DNA-binding protein/ligand-binding sensor protein
MSDFLAAGLAQTTVINRREIEPLFLEAHRLMSWYEKAAGCGTSVLNTDGSFVNLQDNKNPYHFCELCRCFSNTPKNGEEDEYPCMQMHKDAQLKADRGESYIYACKAGFSFWTSPLYAGFRYAGSLMAGQVLAIPREKAAELFHSHSGIPHEKVTAMLSKVPEKTHEETQALAGLLTVCAEKLSSFIPKKSPVLHEKPLGRKSTEKYTVANPENMDKKRAHFQDKERMLLAALRRGDMNAVQKSLDDLLDIIQKNGNIHFDAVRLKFMELAASLSRSAGNPENIENHDRCLRRIQESTNVDELRETLRSYVQHVGTQIFSFRGLRHACALRKAERFIWGNYTRKISLSEIASASGLSAPYFSSIFKEEMGINLSSYLNQLRVEKAAGLLEETGFSLAKIAEACGFEDQNWFSKIFKSRMGLSPGKFREQGHNKNKKEEL